MNAATVGLAAMCGLGLWAAAVGGATLVRAVIGAWQDRTSPTLLRWWLEATALAAVTAAVGAGLAWWAADLVRGVP